MLAWSSTALADGVADGRRAKRSLEELTLEELLDVSVDVATPTLEQPSREAPGVLTVITHEEIVTSGARDLIDVLRIVPGMHLALDVQGMVGIGFRGVWAHEGKVLFLFDGHELNELDYSTLQLGNRLPVDQIERVEIIRGPGSVVYGGLAEIAVIRVIPRSPPSFHGVSTTVTFGQMRHALGRATVSVLAATPVSFVEGLDVRLGAYLGAGSRSDGTYRAYQGGEYSLIDQSALDPRVFHAAASFKGLRLRFLLDDYRTQTRDGFGDIQPAAVEQSFPSYYADATYDWRPNARMTLTPRLQYKRQIPWRVTDRGSELFSDRFNEKSTAGLQLGWRPIGRLHILVGVEGWIERHGLIDEALVGLHRPYSNGELSVSYQDVATFGQVSWRGRVVNITGGMRYEHHSRYGGSFVPRLALTSRFRNLHAKLMFAQAFRAPGVQNLALEPNIRPERTTVGELEIGSTLGRWLYFGANGFVNVIRDPIVFQSFVQAGQDIETYQNLPQTGTWGAEAACRFHHPRLRAQLAYTFYSSAGLDQVDIYAVRGRSDLLTAFPARTLRLDATVNLTDHVYLHHSLLVWSERFFRTGTDAGGQPLSERRAPTVLGNLYAGVRDLGTTGLEVGAGVFNLFDSDTSFLQPYDGGHAPLPGPSREIVARVGYTAALP